MSRGARLPVSLLILLALGACRSETTPAPPPPKAAPEPELDPEHPPDSRTLLETVDAMRDKLKDRPRDFNVNVALGNLYYDNERYTESIEYFTDAIRASGQAEERLLTLPAQRGERAPVPETCRVDRPTTDDATTGQRTRSLESVVAAAAQVEAKDPAGGAACWEQLRAGLAALHARRGNAWYLAGEANRAREDHVAALAIEPDQAEALFFLGALELEQGKGAPAKLDAGRRLWMRLLKVAPDHPRAELVRETLPRIDELFGPNARPPSAPDLAPEVVAAIETQERTPRLEQNLDDLVAKGESDLAAGRWQEALDAFRAVMPLRPDGRVALGLGIALRELGKPTAERVLQQAATLPGADAPRARFELAIYYKKNNRPADAKRLFEGLLGDARWGAEAKARLQAAE